MSYGEDSGMDFATMRGRDYPTIKQFTVFLENRVGKAAGSCQAVSEYQLADRGDEYQRCCGMLHGPVCVDLSRTGT